MKGNFKNLYVHLFLISEYLIYTLSFSSMPVKPEDFAGVQSFKILITISLTLIFILESKCYDEIDGDIIYWDLPVRVRSTVICFISFVSFLLMWKVYRVLPQAVLTAEDLSYVIYMVVVIFQVVGINFLLYNKKGKLKVVFTSFGLLFSIGAGVCLSNIYKGTDLFLNIFRFLESNILFLRLTVIVVTVLCLVPLLGVTWYSESELLDSQSCEWILSSIKHSKEPVKMSEGFCRYVEFSIIRRSIAIFFIIVAILPFTSLLLYSIDKVQYFYNFWKTVLGISYSDVIVIMYTALSFSLLIYSLIMSIISTKRIREILDKNYE